MIREDTRDFYVFFLTGRTTKRGGGSTKQKNLFSSKEKIDENKYEPLRF